MTTSEKKKETARNLMAMRKNERNYGRSSVFWPAWLEYPTYYESIKTSRCKDLILGYPIEDRYPSEETVWQLW